MRVLYLTHRLPYAPNRGDRVRAFHTLRFLSGRADVDLVSLVHDREEQRQADSLGGLTASVATALVPRTRNLVRAFGSLPTRRSLTHALLDAPPLGDILRDLVGRRRPDVVLAYCSGMARFALEPPLRGIPFVLDLVDVDSAKWHHLAEQSTAPLAWVYRREARCLGRFEAAAATRASATLVVNEREAVLARRLAPSARVHVVANGVDVDDLRPPAEIARTPRVVFCGVMNYAPNVQGALWFVRNVWPLVRQQRPDASLVLVGSDPTPGLRTACGGDASIEVTGAVPDVRPYLWSGTVSIAPLHFARGVQNKVLEACAAGLPSVITSAVMDGLPPEIRPLCAVADDPAQFASAVVHELSRLPAERACRAETVDLTALNWPSRLARLSSILEAACDPAGAWASEGHRMLRAAI